MAPLPVLGLDSSAGQCAAAVVSGDGVWRAAERMDRGHAERLMPLVEQVLQEAGLAFSALGGVAVCTGPGSFTGVRIGVAAARGIALGAGIPAVGVTRFEALAEGRHGTAEIVLDGRGGVVFLQRFRDGHPQGEPVSGRRADLGLPEDATAPDDGLPDPAVIARIGAARIAAGQISRPAPLYLRAPDAALPREGPPRRLGPA